MPHEFGRLLTVADVAIILNVRREDVAELIERGELPAIQIQPGIWRVERPVLRAYIDGKYEEYRRAQLWAQVELVDLPDISSGHTAPELRAQHD